MPVVKRSFRLDPVVAEHLDRVAGTGPGRASAAVNAALTAYVCRLDGLAAVREWEAEHGEPSPELLAEADRLLDAAGVALR